MKRRSFFGAAAGAAVAAHTRAGAEPAAAPEIAARSVVWPRSPAAAKQLGHVPAVNGYTDTVPDIIGRIGRPPSLAIFTEGNHLPALLSDEILGAFPGWAAADPRFAALDLGNVVIVTLPQPMIVAMIQERGFGLGNLVVDVGPDSGFYPDLVMGGANPLGQLRRLGVLAADARVFARNRGMALLVRHGNPMAVRGLSDLARPGLRLVLASQAEPGARAQYRAALAALLGADGAAAVLAREVVSFDGRLGIQHRDILQALAMRIADVGIIFRHLAEYWVRTFPGLVEMIPVPGAERFSATIAVARVDTPLRPLAADGFAEFLLGRARTVYPRYGFAEMSEEEYGKPLMLD
jgi:hypothetical protein